MVLATVTREVKPLAADDVNVILVKLATLEAVLTEIRSDVKETKDEAKRTNGRVTAHDKELALQAQELARIDKDLDARVQGSSKARWQVASWLVGPVTGTVSGVLVYLFTR